MSIDDQTGVSEPVPTLGPFDGAGLVDGAAQHCASRSRHSSGARRIRLSSLQSSKRIEGSQVTQGSDASGSHRFASAPSSHRIHLRG